MIKIGQYYFNISNITWIIEREVHFNNGKSIILTEPEIQDLFAVLFNEPRPDISIDTDKVLGINRAIKETREDLGIAKPKKAVKKK